MNRKLIKLLIRSPASALRGHSSFIRVIIFSAHEQLFQVVSFVASVHIPNPISRDNVKNTCQNDFV